MEANLLETISGRRLVQSLCFGKFFGTCTGPTTLTLTLTLTPAAHDTTRRTLVTDEGCQQGIFPDRSCDGILRLAIGVVVVICGVIVIVIVIVIIIILVVRCWSSCWARRVIIVIILVVHGARTGTILLARFLADFGHPLNHMGREKNEQEQGPSGTTAVEARHRKYRRNVCFEIKYRRHYSITYAGLVGWGVGSGVGLGVGTRVGNGVGAGSDVGPGAGGRGSSVFRGVGAGVGGTGGGVVPTEGEVEQRAIPIFGVGPVTDGRFVGCSVGRLLGPVLGSVLDRPVVDPSEVGPSVVDRMKVGKVVGTSTASSSASASSGITTTSGIPPDTGVGRYVGDCVTVGGNSA